MESSARKRTIRLAKALSIVILALATTTVSFADERYVDAANGFSFEPPPGWIRLGTEQSARMAEAAGGRTPLVTFVQYDNGKTVASLEVDVEPSRGVTSDVFSQTTRDEMLRAFIMRAIAKIGFNYMTSACGPAFALHEAILLT